MSVVVYCPQAGRSQPWTGSDAVWLQHVFTILGARACIARNKVRRYSSVHGEELGVTLLDFLEGRGKQLKDLQV